MRGQIHVRIGLIAFGTLCGFLSSIAAGQDPGANTPLSQPRLVAQVGSPSYSSVSISPDGHLALTGGSEGVARLWDLETGKLIRALEGHSGEIRAVAIASDGRHALTGSVDETARFWDLKTGKQVWSLEGHDPVAISPDGRRALTGGGEKTARLWDLETGKLIRRLEGHHDEVNAVAFAPNGRVAITGSIDKTARLWNLERGKTIKKLQGHRAPVQAVAIAPDGRYALTGGGDMARFWDLETGTQIRPFDDYDEIRAIENAKFFVKTGKEIRSSFEGPGALAVAISADGQRALTGKFDKAARLWELQIGRMLRSFKDDSQTVCAVAFTPDAHHALTAVFAEQVSPDLFTSLARKLTTPPRLWDLENGGLIRELKGQVGEVRALAITPDGHRLLTGTTNKATYLWDLSTGKMIRSLSGRGEMVTSVAISPDGRRALTGHMDEIPRLWDLETGKLIRQLDGSPSFGWVFSVAIAPDGRRASRVVKAAQLICGTSRRVS